MNPFLMPERVYISKAPQDMRAGIQRLAAIVSAEFGRDSMDGDLYVFVSRDGEKMKMLRFDSIGWCMYYCRLLEGTFRWEREEGGGLLEVDRRLLLKLLEGVDFRGKAPEPVTAHRVL